MGKAQLMLEQYRTSGWNTAELVWPLVQDPDGYLLRFSQYLD